MSIDVLQTKIRRMKNPSMIGMDPALAMLPPQLLEEACSRHGKTMLAVSSAFETFCQTLLQTLQDVVPAVKFQSACFEALGAEGMAAMQRLMKLAQDLGYYVVLDCDYGSAGHISEVVAQSIFEGLQLDDVRLTPYACDGITVNGYLGGDSIKPFLPYCQKTQKNLFVYVKTSNKSSREVQDLISGDRVIYTAMADLAMRWSIDLFGKNGYSEIAAVVGAPFPHVMQSLRAKYDRLFFMVPGYGAQGGVAKNVQYAFDKFGHGAVVCASRSVIAAWQKTDSDGSDYAACARAAAEKMRDDIAKYVKVI